MQVQYKQVYIYIYLFILNLHIYNRLLGKVSVVLYCYHRFYRLSIGF